MFIGYIYIAMGILVCSSNGKPELIGIILAIHGACYMIIDAIEKTHDQTS